MAWLDRKSSQAEDELDHVLRQSLRHEFGTSEPPGLVWERIRGQVSAGPSPRRRPPVRSWGHLFAPLVQGLAAMVVLLLLGFSLSTNFLVHSYQLGTHEQLAPSPLPLVAMAETASSEPLPEVADRQAPVAFEGMADLLSQGVLLRYEQEALEAEKAAREAFLRVTRQASNPELDPLLVNRRVLVD